MQYLEICLLTTKALCSLTFYFFVFFCCRNKMKYSWYQDSSCLQSRLALEIGYKV